MNNHSSGPHMLTESLSLLILVSRLRQALAGMAILRDAFITILRNETVRYIYHPIMRIVV